jgi:hypothetical protein
MVIAYVQNLHFKIHCKKLQKQDYNSFHHNLILQKIQRKYEQRIIVEVCTKNMNPNYNIIPSFVEKKSKQHFKSMLYPNKVCGFLLQEPIAPPTLL